MVKLKKVDYSNIFKILELDVYSNQKDCVATNAQSIADAYLCETKDLPVYPFGIYNDNDLVGFIMISYGSDPDTLNPPSVSKDNYCIWRLMIDKKYQRKGYGSQAIKLAIDFIKTWPNGKAKYCYLSYEPRNELAKKLYHSLGFIENGEEDDGEIVAVYKLD